VKAPKPLVVDAHIKAGVLMIPDRQQLRAALKRWPDGPVEVEVRPHLETRRARANRYYWGVVLKMMAEEMEQSAEDVHEVCKLRHNSKHLDGTFALVGTVQIAQSTAKLDINAFSLYLERVMLDGNEYLGIVFPPPRKSEEWRDASSAKARTA
jgi:hypothetical protein